MPRKWSAGPAAVAVWTPGKWVVGALINNQWSFAGDSSERSVNAMLLQPFVNYNIADGWYLTSSPIITADWNARESKDTWTVPVGGGVGRLFRLDKLPINASIQAFDNVETPAGRRRLDAAAAGAVPVPQVGRRAQVQLLADLMAKPASLSRPSRYTVMNGVIYLGAGALLILWPGATQTVFMDRAFVGDEAALVRVIGMTVAVIGWLYLFGGRSGARQIVAASVLDRLVLVPAVLVPLAIAGVFPHLLGTFAILDPALGIGAWALSAAGRDAGKDRDQFPSKQSH